MKNNEMVSQGMVSFNLPEKFADDHPVAAIAICLAPVILPTFYKSVKYIVDKGVECYRFKVMAENGMIANVGDDFETSCVDDSIIS